MFDVTGSLLKQNTLGGLFPPTPYQHVQKAAINYSTPGAMGTRTLRKYTIFATNRQFRSVLRFKSDRRADGVPAKLLLGRPWDGYDPFLPAVVHNKVPKPVLPMETYLLYFRFHEIL